MEYLEYKEDDAKANENQEILRDDDPGIKEQIDDGVGVWVLIANGGNLDRHD